MKRVFLGAVIFSMVLGACADRVRESKRAPEDAPQRGAVADVVILVREGVPARLGQDEVLGGELCMEREGKRVPLPVERLEVRAEVVLNISSVTVHQRFQNPFDEKVEARYVFPLPESAAVRDFVLTIGTRQIRGIIRDRDEAERIHAEAKRQGYLTTQLIEGATGCFAIGVSNIEAKKEVGVALSYVHELPYQEGAFEFWFPMGVGSREGSLSQRDVSLAVSIEAGLAMEEPVSSTHEIRVERHSASRVDVTLVGGDRIPNRSCVLRWAPRRTEEVVAAIGAYREGPVGYVALLVVPSRHDFTDVNVDWGEGSPVSLGAVSRGTPILVMQRFSTRGRHVVRVSGSVVGEQRDITLPIDLDAPLLSHVSFPVMWAQRRIRELSEGSKASAWSLECLREVRELALKYGLASEFTAFIAVDASRKVADK